ncbi:hypothetical protein K0M31_001367 [Melipona bicolor]|uniref:Uncharacterized protein n=1 Tax=Melipona bicolor TaxID=60889 RepID=A0AA40GFC9_9HYME|nr:hypothetical protein K0M31_001367 [Melipona bicolor]
MAVVVISREKKYQCFVSQQPYNVVYVGDVCERRERGNEILHWVGRLSSPSSPSKTTDKKEGSPGKGGNHAQAHRRNSHGGALNEGRLVEERKENEDSTQRRRLPASPAVGNPGSSIESGRRYVRSERASERRRRAREEVDASLPLGEESLPERYPGSCKAGAADSRLYPHPGVRGVSAQSFSAFALSRQRCLWPAATASGGGGSDSGRGGRTTLRVSPSPTRRLNAASRVGEATPRRSIKPRPDTPTVTTAQLLRRPRRRGAHERGSVWWCTDWWGQSRHGAHSADPVSWRGGSGRPRRGGEASSSAARPDVGTSLSGLSFIKILFRA